MNEALAKDNFAKCKERGESKKLSDSRREVGKFIQIIHRYRDNMLAKIKNPVENGILEIDPEKAVKQQHDGYGEVEHVAIFDEAQRSWTHKRLADYLKRGMLAIDGKAGSIYQEIKDKYQIVLTRDMEKARRWLHENVRGTERTGVLIPKESARYKPLGVHVLQSGDENAVHWFLEDKADTRSSNYLEDAATEIQVQGLELDYTCSIESGELVLEEAEEARWLNRNTIDSVKWLPADITIIDKIKEIMHEDIGKSESVEGDQEV